MAAAELQLIPIGELAPGQTGAIRNQLIQELVRQAVSQLKIAPDRLVVRDIRPASDLDFGTEDWSEETGGTTGAFETMSTGTLADQRWVGFYGVKDNSEVQAVSQLRFNVGGGDKAIWNLQALNEQDGRIGLTPGIVVLTPNAPYTISRYVIQANVGTQIVLKGLVVEPRGKVLSP